MQDWKKFAAWVLGTSLSLVAAGSAEAAWYTHEYTAEGQPKDAIPAWTEVNITNANRATYTGNSDFTATTGLTNPGYLRVESTVATRPYFTMSGTNWNVGSAFTIELRAKMVSVDGAAGAVMHFIVGDATSRALMSIGTSGLTLSGDTVTAAAAGYAPTEYTTYRVIGEKVGSAWNYNLYINDNPTPVVANNDGQSATVSQIILGDTSTSNTGGTYEIDYVRWNPTQAVAVPEPVSVMLVGLGAVGLAGRRRRTA